MAHRSNLICSALLLAIAAGSARADNPKHAAQVLVTDGMQALAHKRYDDALDKFRAAYDMYASPKILLDIGSTLRDMGRLADAANEYARYLDDAGADAKRSVEVKKLLRDLDKQLTVLVIDVTPMGADVAIDDGPWIPVAGRMQTRADAGMHLVRARHAGLAPQQVRVDGHPGAHDDVTITLRAPEAAPPPPPPVAIAPPPPPPTPDEPTPAWAATARANRTPPRVAAAELMAPDDEPIVVAIPARPAEPGIAGLEVGSRIDEHFRGAAAAFGIVVDTSGLETEISAIIGHDATRVAPGGYLGFRLHAGRRIRPFLGAGAPMIWSGDEARFAIRGSAGLEMFLSPHLGVLVDLGIEHFFNPQPTYDPTQFVPIVGLQGRL